MVIYKVTLLREINKMISTLIAASAIAKVITAESIFGSIFGGTEKVSEEANEFDYGNEEGCSGGPDPMSFLQAPPPKPSPPSLSQILSDLELTHEQNMIK